MGFLSSICCFPIPSFLRSEKSGAENHDSPSSDSIAHEKKAAQMASLPAEQEQQQEATGTTAKPPPSNAPLDPSLLIKHLSHPIDFSKDFDKSTLKGQSALITGGGNGLGEGFSRALAAEGYAPCL
jgi:hypothetical protein